MSSFFQNAFDNMPPEARESFYKTIFLHDSSDYAAQVRKDYYAGVLKHMGENVTIGIGVKIVNPQYISIGDNVKISDHVTLIARGEGGITIGDNTMLCDRVYLDTENADGGYIKIENDVYLGTGTTLFGHKGLEIGDHCLLAQNITLTPYSHIFTNPNQNIIDQGGHSKKVTIGRDSYLGMGVDVMYSGDIGEGSVIGAGSVVVKPIPPYSVAVGNPAKVIRQRKE